MLQGKILNFFGQRIVPSYNNKSHQPKLLALKLQLNLSARFDAMHALSYKRSKLLSWNICHALSCAIGPYQQKDTIATMLLTMDPNSSLHRASRNEVLDVSILIKQAI